ncbi:hypothetical protein BRM3_02480 [Brachybacterium huguangmaarense]|uniref:PaaX family transcriptional regulator n=1 Tax=Brachybacterium huguangmaarense TaxID=1652028 RepID=A0ABY6G289_9MICO|nr:hypothetical protein [Brachybacterium huguangmaarense]UYG17317.1 hypothetical protein BRM3_02480 [Brachybacterium huguangmaarense]
MPRVSPSRYRMTRAAFDLVSVFGCLGAVAVPGPAFAAVLAHRGYSALSVRNELVRLVDRGLLVRSTAGRVSVYRRSTQLDGGFVRYSGAQETAAYDGSFRALLVTIPETRRGDRDRVLHVARHWGYRPLRAGVLIAVREQPDDLSRQLERLVGDEAGIEHCRLVPESDAQARAWARRAFAAPEEAEVERLAARVRELGAAPAFGHREYFDLFHEVAMAIERTEVLPEALSDRDGGVGVRARRLMAAVVELWAQRMLDEQLAEVLALPAAGLIAWDPGFWARVGRPMPGADEREAQA